MKTITFYSYKGGVGRTLLLANVAKYLARFGQKVFAIDFDLEAPGLHYKLGLNRADATPISGGVVDYVYSYAVKKQKPHSLKEYVIKVSNGDSSAATIHLMPAGNVPTSTYWRQLAQISWHDLFYSDDAKGVPFFLDLKARIKKEFEPDYLLIDSRTGITEIGGVATTILPEYVVCLLLRNRENLEGAREVLRSINRTLRLRNQSPIKIIPVVTRLPVMEDSTEEKRIISEVRDFLNADASDLADTLSISELPVLHTDRAIEIEESLLIGGNTDVEQSPLLRDYIRLFAQIVPQDVLEPHIEPLVNEALIDAWDNPERAERDLVALTQYSSHPAPYRALLKFYRVRNVGDVKILRTAYNYWQLINRADDLLLWEIVKDNFDSDSVKKAFVYPEADAENEARRIPLSFIYEVWQAAGAKDGKVGIDLAGAYRDSGMFDQAASVVQKLVENRNLSDETVVGILKILSSIRNVKAGLNIVNEYKGVISPTPDFIMEWADLVVKSEDATEANDLLQQTSINLEVLREHDLLLYAKLLKLAGKDDELRRYLLEETNRRRGYPGFFRRYLRNMNINDLIELGKLYDEFDLLPMFTDRLREEMPSDEFEHIVRYLRYS